MTRHDYKPRHAAAARLLRRGWLACWLLGVRRGD
jgi:hypothetical protein